MKLRFARYIIVFVLIVAVSFAAGIAISRISAMNIMDKLVLEAGEELPPAGSFFESYNSKAVYVTDMSGIDSNKPGTYDIEIISERRNYKSILEIRDTTPPKADVREIDLYTGESVSADQFVYNVTDVTDVTIEYKEEPDFSKINIQNVIIVLKDTSGNTTEYETTLRISRVKKAIQVEASDGTLDAVEFLKQPDEKG
ncbi:MAG: hypothetical protein GX045_01275, partial [Clostridiaceae bacterium]|nr:hypothetical protein [Clostridiaceae bacterium]